MSVTKKQKTKTNSRPYPRVNLEESLKICSVIKEKNGGNAWPPSEIARALGASLTSTNFFYKTSASQAFGLTIGTREAKKIELTELGRAIVYAPNSEAEITKKREAFFSVDIFKKVFEYYGGNKLPETKYLANTLESEFKLIPEFHDEFVKVFQDNCKYLNIESTNDVSSLDKIVDSGSGTLGNKTVVLSIADNKNAQEAFVIMPFSEKTEKYPKGFFDEVLNSLITPAAAEAGFTVKTAKRDGSDVIQSTIINALIEADLVIADLTEHNPNVLFELGVRMAIKKPVLLIRAKNTDKIFDVDNMLRVYDYNPNLWTSTLKSDILSLSKYVEAAWGNRGDKTYIEILKSNST